MTNKTKPTPGCCCAETVRIEGACSLHAAAPDLLAACQLMAATPRTDINGVAHAQNQIQAAIAKAQGGKS